MKTYKNTITSNSAKGILFLHERLEVHCIIIQREIKACWTSLQSENKKLLGL